MMVSTHLRIKTLLFLVAIIFACWFVFLGEKFPNEFFSCFANGSSKNCFSKSDYTKLIDINNFQFKTLNTICTNSTKLLILVHSAPKNFDKRKVIRETWGSYRNNTKLIFLLGEVKITKDQRKLDKENADYRDIVQGSFIDAYRNMTYKHVMALKYIIYFCSNVEYAIKTDDDIFVNIESLTKLLEEYSYTVSKSVLMCVPATNLWVERERTKWKVLHSEYSARHYPPYCLGWFLVYSYESVVTLYREAQKAQYFWIDDAHITGTLRKKTSLMYTSVSALKISRGDVRKLNNTTSKIFLCAGPELKESDIKKAWEFVQAHSINISEASLSVHVKGTLLKT